MVTFLTEKSTPVPPDDPMFKRGARIVSINKFRNLTSDTEETTAEAPQNQTTFDPNFMQAEAEQMLKDGTMPPEKALEAALERIRAEYGPKILKARELDERENSSGTSPSTHDGSRSQKQ